MKSIFKCTAFCFFLTITTSLLKVSAQTFPQWDITPDTDPNSPAYYYGGAPIAIAGQGQSLYMILYSGNGEINTDFVQLWSRGTGWKTLALAEDYAGSGGTISLLAVRGNYLYVLGSFDQLEDVNYNTIVTAHNIAKYNISTGQWSTVGNDDFPDLAGDVTSMVVDSQGDIYLGLLGAIPQALWEWKSSSASWMSVGEFGLYPQWEGEVDSGIIALTTDGTNVYAAGGFDWAQDDNGTEVDSVAVIKWDGTQFEPIDTPFNPTNLSVTMTGFGIGVTGTNLFLSGDFQSPNYGLLRFSTVTGLPLPCDNLYADSGGVNPAYGLNMVTKDGNLYLSGYIPYIGPDTGHLLAVNGIAMWTNDGTATGTWSALGSGLTADGGSWGGNLAADDNSVFVSSDIYGYQLYAGGIPITYNPPVVRWMTGEDDYFVDSTFNPSVDGEVSDVAIDSNGNILIAGSFSHVNGQAVSQVARLKPDGTLDTTFNPSAAIATGFAGGNVNCIASDSLGRVYLGGDGALVRVDSSGNLTKSDSVGDDYIFPLSANGTIDVMSGGGHPILVSNPETIMRIGGSFTNILGRLNYCVADIWLTTNDFSTIDSDYANVVPPPISAIVTEMAQTIEGSTLLCGDIGSYDGDWEICTANPPMSFDPTFNGGADGPVWAVAVQSDGKIVVGGDFWNLGTDPWYDQGGGSPHYHLGRFNTDGTVDNTFNPSSNWGGHTWQDDVESVLLEPDGQIFAAGGNIEKFCPNGTLNLTIPANGSVNRMIQESSDQVIAVGYFTTVGGQSHSFIVRLTRQ